MHESWKKVLEKEFASEYFKELSEFVRTEYQKGGVFPHPKNLFAAFDATPFDTVRVVILGQDPYHGKGQAHGLSFSVQEGVERPPSLQNILKEVVADVGSTRIANGNLTPWASQGVLLLNTVLTVQEGSPGSHAGKGWEQFTDAAIRAVSEGRDHVVFLLWGAYAQKKRYLIDAKKHLLLEAPHPSPLSAHRGFFGCRHFSKTNEYLSAQGAPSIEW
jgi:uracil-DNA glycosylase